MSDKTFEAANDNDGTRWMAYRTAYGRRYYLTAIPGVGSSGFRWELSARRKAILVEGEAGRAALAELVLRATGAAAEMARA